jgi:hypothetical protein
VSAAVNGDPATSARRALRRLGINGILGTLLGVALVVGGFGWFGYLGDQDSWLLQNGHHTTAMVVATNTARTRSNFDPHMVVAFVTDAGRRVETDVHLAEDSGYVAGQQVDIVYDPARPDYARVVGSSSSLPPIAWAAFAMLIIGGVALIPSAHAVLFAWHGRRALRFAPSNVVARKLVVRSGRAKAYRLVVQEVAGPLQEQPRVLVIKVNRLRRSFLRGSLVQPVPAVMYRAPGILRAFVLIVDPARGLISGGRTESLWHRLRHPDRRPRA